MALARTFPSVLSSPTISLCSGSTVFPKKPPFTPALHALALVLFGHSMLAIRILDLLWQTATALAIHAVARRLSRGRLVSLLAVFLYLLTYYSFRFADIAQTDGFLNLPTALAVLAFLNASHVRAADLANLEFEIIPPGT